MKGNVIQLNTLHLNSVRLNGIGKVQSVSLKGGSTEDPVFPPVEPPVEPTPTYTLSASVTNGKVSAKRNGSAVTLPFTANEGDVIVLEVTPNDGYTFEGWTDGNTDNPRSITMNADVTLSAQCVEVVQPPVGNYIQFEDKAVEAICVANWSSDGIGLTEEDAAAVTSIGTTFSGNTEITSFEEFRYFTGVNTLNARAFDSCSSLKRIYLPPNLSTIPDYEVFDGCTSLESVRINSNITYIGAESFRNCSSLTDINIPASVKKLGNRVFQSCSSWEGEIDLPNVTTMGAQVFHMSAVKRVRLTGVQTIEYDVFDACPKLEYVEFGEGLKQFAGSLCRGCTSLHTFICRAATPPTAGNNIIAGSNNAIIYVPDASLEAYKTAVNWSAYADRIHPLSEIEDYYVSDALLMHLDGINKGNVEGEWQDLVSGNTFVNHGAVAEADGWRFDGASSYMDSATLTNYGPGYSDRTIEVVAEFERENTTELVYMGGPNGYAFGRYAGGKSILLGSNVLIPSLADDMTSGVRIVSISTKDALQIVASKINGNNAQVGSENYFDGGVDFIYLGSRASGNHFKGKIHAVRIHNRILTEEEILYNQRLDNKRFNLGLDI